MVEPGNEEYTLYTKCLHLSRLSIILSSHRIRQLLLDGCSAGNTWIRGEFCSQILQTLILYTHCLQLVCIGSHICGSVGEATESPGPPVIGHRGSCNPRYSLDCYSAGNTRIRGEPCCQRLQILVLYVHCLQLVCIGEQGGSS